MLISLNPRPPLKAFTCPELGGRLKSLPTHLQYGCAGSHQAPPHSHAHPLPLPHLSAVVPVLDHYTAQRPPWPPAMR